MPSTHDTSYGNQSYTTDRRISTETKASFKTGGGSMWSASRRPIDCCPHCGESVLRLLPERDYWRTKPCGHLAAISVDADRIRLNIASVQPFPAA